MKTPVGSHSLFRDFKRSSLSFPLYRYLIGLSLVAFWNTTYVSSSDPRMTSRHFVLYPSTLARLFSSVCQIILFLKAGSISLPDYTSRNDQSPFQEKYSLPISNVMMAHRRVNAQTLHGLCIPLEIKGRFDRVRTLSYHVLPDINSL